MASSSNQPNLAALILIGGKSTRMGSDKSLLDYHGKPQWIYSVELFDGLVEKVFISVRKDQKINFPNVIEDKYDDLGPFGAIFSALESFPNTAFLIFAVDIPFLNKKNIEILIKNRDIDYLATAFIGKNKDYAEPLACIWEPTMFPVLKEYFEKGIFKPIQILKQSKVKHIVIEDDLIRNINTSEEFLNCRTD